MPFHLVLVAAALAWRPRWTAAVVVAPVVLQLSTVPAWRMARQGENWRDIAALLQGEMRAGDALYLSNAPAILLLTHLGFQPAGHTLFAQMEWRWFRRFPGEILVPATTAAALATQSRLWIVTRRDSVAHEALLGALGPVMAEQRLQRAGPGRDSGIDVSVLTRR